MDAYYVESAFVHAISQRPRGSTRWIRTAAASTDKRDAGVEDVGEPYSAAMISLELWDLSR